MFNKILAIGLFMGSALFGAAQSETMNIYNLAYYAIQEKNPAMQSKAVHAIRKCKQDGGLQVLNTIDDRNMKPFDYAILAINNAPVERDPYMRKYQKCVLFELIPMCRTEMEEYGRKVSSLMLSPDSELRKIGAEAFYRACPEQLDSIREQFRYITGGHFVEASLDEAEGIDAIVSKHVVQKLNETGNEKVYAIQFLKYLLSPLCKTGTLPVDKLDSLLYHVVQSEETLPSLVPELLTKDVFAHASFKTGGQYSSSFDVVLARLAKEPQSETVNSHLSNFVTSTFIEPEFSEALNLLHAGFSVWRSSPWMDMVRMRSQNGREASDDELKKTISYLRYTKQCNEKVKDMLGELGKHFTSEDYKLNWHKWLKVSMLLGADIKVLRQSVLPLLKKKIYTQDAFDTVKMIRNGELDDFHKFAMACVTQEFLVCVAESSREPNPLQENTVYDLDRYCKYGEVVICTGAEEKAFHEINAGRYFSSLLPEAQEIILSL